MVGSKKDDSYIIQLDGIRFFAILFVMVAHWLQWQVDNSGVKGFPFANGVTLFFVLSGFLITDILIKNKARYEEASLGKGPLIKSFYIRRFLRIFPIYYLTIFFLYFLNYKNTHEVFPWLVSYSTNIYQSIKCVSLIDFDHFWSLAVEEQFYLFWPWLIIFIPLRHIEKVIIFIIALSVLSKAYIFFYMNNWMANSYFTLSCMHALGLGALLAYWSVYRKNLIKMLTKIYWVLIGVAIYFAIHYINYFNQAVWPKEIIDDFLFALMSALVIIYASQDKFRYVMKFILENKFVVYSGKISYGMYIYHFFVPTFFWYMSARIGVDITNKYTAFIVFYFITFLMAHISWKLIESPINSLKRKFPYFKKPR